MRAPETAWHRPGALLLLLSIAFSACGKASESVSPTGPTRSAIPPQGTAGTLDFGTWNLEWFGDPGQGPADEALQLENVRHVIAGLEMDVWSVQEVTGAGHFADLVSRLSGYDGILADDPFVTDGAAHYSGFGGNEMKVGIIYRTAAVDVRSARVILREHDGAFAGRPPVEVRLTATANGAPVDLVVILLHAKAGSQDADWERRHTGSRALKAYLDGAHPTARVLVIGDFNDDVDTSITRLKESPYRNFVEDAASYAFPSGSLSEMRSRSTVGYSEMIDHHLATNELMTTYQAGSVQVFRADEYVTDYAATTSDHYPVLSSFLVSSGSGASSAAVGADRACPGDAGCFPGRATAPRRQR